MRLLSCKPKRNGAEFWFADTTVDDVADLFLRFFLSIGFALHTGSASNGLYVAGRWPRRQWYKVKIKQEARSVHATITREYASKKIMVPLREHLLVFSNDPANLQPLGSVHTTVSRKATNESTVPLTNDLLQFLYHPANLQQAAPHLARPNSPNAAQQAGQPKPSGWNVVGAIISIPLGIALALLILHLVGVNLSDIFDGSSETWYLHWSCGGQAQCASVMGGATGVQATSFSSDADCESVRTLWADNGTMQKWNGTGGDWCSQSPSRADTHP